jgi:hypothetical protein
MCIDDMLDNSKPQAGSTQFSASGGVSAVKPLEESRKVFRPNSDAVVPERNAKLGVLMLHLNFNAAARSAVFDSIIQKIHECLLNQHCIEIYRKRFFAE